MNTLPPLTKILSKILSIVIAAITLSACGGGGGGGSSDSTSQSANNNSSQSETFPAPQEPPPDQEPATKTIDITLSWNIPTQREDGSGLDLTEIGGYEIYYFLEGSTEGEGETVNIPAVDNNNQYVTSHDVQLNQTGSYVFAISTYDTNNVYSVISEPVTVDIQ